MLPLLAIIISSLGAVWLVYLIVRYRRKKRPAFPPLNNADRQLLLRYVQFYRDLNDQKKLEFEQRLVQFLSQVKVTGVKTSIERIDQLLVAASAIIPIFNFPNWEYINLHEVLLYPGSFDQQFNQEGEERTRAGVVGDGPYQNIMILSKPDLHYGFMDNESSRNTGIHEFVHLVDKTDGAIDGIPTELMDQQYVLPWLAMMQQKIIQIRNAESEIDPYGATNQAEFFAVAAEYFFKQPGLLAEKHPELFSLLSTIFRVNNDKNDLSETTSITFFKN